MISNDLESKISRSIPPELKQKLKSKEFRKILFNTVGRTAYLDQDNLKFPVKDETGKYVCQLIFAAYLRAKVNIGRTRTNNIPDSYYQSIANKAKILYMSNKCNNKMNVKIHENDNKEIMDCLAFFEFFDLSDLQLSDQLDYVE